MYFAQYDSTAPQPTSVTGWHEGVTPAQQLVSSADLIELTQEQWDSRLDTPFVKNGLLIPEPVKTPEQLLAIANAQLRASAQIALDTTDLTAFRCFKAGVAYPAEWQSYSLALRNIVNGTDAVSTALPLKPAYPAGT